MESIYLKERPDLQEKVDRGDLLDSHEIGKMLNVEVQATVHRIIRAYGFKEELAMYVGSARRFFYKREDIDVIVAKREAGESPEKSQPTKSRNHWEPPSLEGFAPHEKKALEMLEENFAEVGVEKRIVNYLLAKAEERAWKWSPNLDRPFSLGQ